MRLDPREGVDNNFNKIGSENKNKEEAMGAENEPVKCYICHEEVSKIRDYYSNVMVSNQGDQKTVVVHNMCSFEHPEALNNAA